MNIQIPSVVYKRKILSGIIEFLDEEIVIAIHGARQVGKTYLLYSLIKYFEENKKPYLYFDLEDPLLLTDLNKGYQQLLKILKDKGIGSQEKIYVLIDEVQYLDNPSSFIKLLADHHRNIHLIVSGSSTFAIKSKFRDSLVGRLVDFELFPLDFGEFLEFKKLTYNLAKITSPPIIDELIGLYQEFIRFGGYPRIVITGLVEKKKVYLNKIIDDYLRKDIRDLGHIENITKFNSLLILLASQSGQLLNTTRLSKETGISIPTLEKYLSILEETYVLKLIKPYSRSPHIEIVKSPKIFFYDSGLTALLWLRDFPKTILGSLFETNIFGEYVKKYGRDSLNYWRTKNKQEVDFVFKMIPIEVKINFASFEKSAVTSFQNKYKTSDFRVIGLLGERKDSQYIYPWEI